ncbi:MAG: hypothetical protein HOQ05_10565 [Corynebacteriales bacterium]|nr:hypothetical protein [Mycobacteriales bacterium]
MTTTRQERPVRQVAAPPRKRRPVNGSSDVLRKEGSTPVRQETKGGAPRRRAALDASVPVQRRVNEVPKRTATRSDTAQPTRRRVRVVTQVETESLLGADAKTGPRAPFVALLLVLIVSGMVGLVLLNTAINENAFRLYELKREAKTKDLEEKQYERDLAELESPGEIDRAARQLGLVHAGTPAFIELPSGEVQGKPSPAGG